MRLAGKIAALLGLYALGLVGCGSGSSNLFSTSAYDIFQYVIEGEWWAAPRPRPQEDPHPILSVLGSACALARLRS